MRLKLVLAISLAFILLTLAAAPLLLAAGSEIAPLGPAQSDPRAAYRALFEHIGEGGRAWWAQQAFDHAGTTYAPGTLIAPQGLSGSGFDKFSVTGPVTPGPALALNAEETRVAVFRTTVTGPYGDAAWELADVRETLDTYLWGSLRYDVLDEAQLAMADLSQYAILIIPAVRWGNEAEVTAALSSEALAKIKSFVEAGGFVYAQANGATIAEAAGVIDPGTVNLAATLVLTTGTPANAGQMSLLNPASPLAFSLLTDTLYLLTDPVYTPGSLEVVAEYANLAGPNQPALLTGEVGKGRVILVDGHPTAATRRSQLPLFFNALLWALGRPAELFGDAVQVYNPAFDPHLLPAYEPGTPVSVTLTFANVWDTPVENVVITEVVTEGFTVDPASLSPAATITAQTNPTQTLVTWNLGDVPPGEVSLSFMAYTDDQALRKGEITFATGQANFTLNGRPHTASHQPFTLLSRMPARMQLDRDIEADRQYYIPSDGLYLDVTVPLENKEDTKATHVVITDVVLLIAPIVNLEDQETILDLNSGETIWIRHEPFFYGETTGPPYQPADGYTPSQTLTLDDWDHHTFAAFDVPYGTHLCGLEGGEIGALGTGNCVTIPVSYTNYITLTADNKLLLPAQVLTWDLGEWAGYHYEEPAIRYGIHSRELFSRTVTFAGDPGIMPEQLVIQGTGGSIYTHLGDYPIFYRDHVTHTLVYVPQSPVTPLISYEDIWSRTHTATLRSAFYDVFSWASCGSCGPGTGDRHAMLNVTFGMKADTDKDGVGDREVLVYPSRLNRTDLDIMIKDKALLSSIPANQMVIDMGVFKGLGVNIHPRNGDWAHSWSSPNSGVQLVDIETPAPAYDHLIFQHNVPTGDTVIIILHAAIDSYSDTVAEGMLKLHDGARFTYRQQAAGPNRYEAYDTHVQGVLAEAPQLTIVKQGTPVQVSTYGDTIYYVFTIDDKDDPRSLTRNGFGDPFLQSFGFGETAATTYLGGREKKKILHSLVKPGEMTRLRVELNNNSDTAWTGVTVTPQPPAGIKITPTYTNPATVPLPIFPDIPFLSYPPEYKVDIPEAGRGVYYFEVYVDPAYSGPTGQMVEIPLAVSGSGLPDQFKIPPAQLGIENAAGEVYHVYGPAQTLVLTDSLPSYVNLTGAAMATQAQVDTLTGAADAAGRANIFNNLPEKISYTPPDGVGQVQFNLPNTILGRLYDPTNNDSLHVVAQGIISPASAGPNWANYGAGLSYSDSNGLTWQEISDRFQVEAHGAAIRVNYACTQVITGVTLNGLMAAETADPSTCLLETGENHEVTLQMTVYNDGDYLAKAVEPTVTLPSNVIVLSTNPLSSAVTTSTVTWPPEDLAPGGFRVVELTAFIPVNEAGVIAPSAVQAYAQVIQHSDGQFTDTFSQRLIAARLAGDYNLPVHIISKTSTIYLPTVFKEANLKPDLIVESLTASSNGVVMVIKNIGSGPAVGAFWVDVYLNPTAPPEYNQRWQDVAAEGLVWGVTQAIPAGDTLTLTIGDAFYSAQRSNFSGAIPSGTPVWAQVDSVNLDTDYGGVLESNEGNNLKGPTLAEANAVIPSTKEGEPSAPDGNLPQR